MTEETKTTSEIVQEPVAHNVTQPVSQNENQPVSQNQQVEAQTQAEPQGQQEKPKETADINWKKAREIMKAQHAEISNLKKEIAGMRNPPKDEFEGIDKDDYITFEQAQRLAEKKAELRAQEIASRIVDEKLQVVEGERLEEKARSKFSDYDYVIENFAIPMIEQNPQLANAIKSSPNWAELAYRFAKSSPEYEAEMSKRQQARVQPEIEKVLHNNERPLSSTAAGSSLKSQVEQFSTLSPEDVWKKAKEYARKAC